jgi:phage shock protein C
MAYRNPKNTFYRSKDGAVLGGVCSGLSESFKIDITIVRILWLFMLLSWGSGLLLYIILWIVLPEKNALDI